MTSIYERLLVNAGRVMFELGIRPILKNEIKY